jgi:hypothetical protein
LTSACGQTECHDGECPPPAGGAAEAGEKTRADVAPGGTLYRRNATDGLLANIGEGNNGHSLPYLCLVGESEIVRRREMRELTPLSNASYAELMDALGFSSTPRSVGLDRDTTVQETIERLAADSKSLNFVASTRYSNGSLRLRNARPAPGVSDPCPAGFVQSIELGAQLVYGLRIELKDDEALENLTQRFGTSDMLELLEQPEAVQEALAGRARLEVFVLQVGGRGSSPAFAINEACTPAYLQGCSEVLRKLSDVSDRFGSSLAEPTVEDYAGWSQVRLRLGSSD